MQSGVLELLLFKVPFASNDPRLQALHHILVAGADESLDEAYRVGLLLFVDEFIILSVRVEYRSQLLTLGALSQRLNALGGCGWLFQ